MTIRSPRPCRRCGPTQLHRPMFRRLAIAGHIAWLLAAGAVGCTASGKPRFVKITPDSRTIIFEDRSYARVYCFDVPTRTKHTFPGRFHCKCMDRDARSMVLRSLDVDPLDLKCVLVRFDDGRPVVLDLPVQRIPFFYVAIIEFGPAPNQIQAMLYEGPWTNGKTLHYVLTIGEPQWTECPSEKPAPTLLCDLLHYHLSGARESGHVYDPFSGWPSGIHIRGVDLQEVSRNKRYGYIINSPDGTFRVNIDDINDPWQRLTLVDLSSNKKYILLDKDDAASDIWDAVYTVLVMPLSLISPRF